MPSFYERTKAITMLPQSCFFARRGSLLYLRCQRQSTMTRARQFYPRSENSHLLLAQSRTRSLQNTPQYAIYPIHPIAAHDAELNCAHTVDDCPDCFGFVILAIGLLFGVSLELRDCESSHQRAWLWSKTLFSVGQIFCTRSVVGQSVAPFSTLTLVTSLDYRCFGKLFIMISALGE